ncbi:hypothetical protein MWU54_07025 [Marivita sp. S6314]|uniref:hypothetical protein n=1 Tax=Marivita sp. S6314 TaxID=2926406 RepID=UPI001FF5ED63|nr:hypothetical protein [Marivita sp. S6314]MCK0149768.1 hypothetical protein [Marivita sp. S6314]
MTGVSVGAVSMWRLGIIVGLGLSACAQFPEVDAALNADNPNPDYPKLVPFEELLTADDPRISETDDDALRARAEDLRRRANGLRPPVIDRDTRDRMDAGVTQP